jgi:hypothetical protein
MPKVLKNFEILGMPSMRISNYPAESGMKKLGNKK